MNIKKYRNKKIRIRVTNRHPEHDVLLSDEGKLVIIPPQESYEMSLNTFRQMIENITEEIFDSLVFEIK